MLKGSHPDITWNPQELSFFSSTNRWLLWASWHAPWHINESSSWTSQGTKSWKQTSTLLCVWNTREYHIWSLKSHLSSGVSWLHLQLTSRQTATHRQNTNIWTIHSSHFAQLFSVNSVWENQVTTISRGGFIVGWRLLSSFLAFPTETESVA